jgi:VWFA-related protein
MKKSVFTRPFTAFLLAVSLLLSGTIAPANAQSGRRPFPPATTPSGEPPKNKPEEQAPRTQPRPAPAQTPETPDDNNTIKIDTTLITIPVSVLDRDGRYVPFLKKKDFYIYEDGLEQEIESFAAVNVPFHVVLLLDTSRSTVFRLEDIQEAAYHFTSQLRPDDRVMVVSFDDRIRLHCDFTNDRYQLRRAIFDTRTGGGTKLYDAVEQTIATHLDPIQGRKAIVLFTDGVDSTSKRASDQSTVELVEESDVLVYPIKYDTEADMRPGAYGGRNPGGQPPIINIPWPQPRRRWPFTQWANPQWQQWPRGGQYPRGTSSEEYRRAAQYLQDLADRSGGRLFRADTLGHVSSAFTQIAEELRHQYALSYYPTNAAQDGTYRKIRVRVSQPNAVVRARAGYRASGGAQAQTEQPQLKRKYPGAQ